MKLTSKIFSISAVALFAAGSLTAQVYPTAVLNYNPGPLADGFSTLAVDRPVRSNPNEALGVVTLATQDVNIGEGGGNIDFVSLGYGGSIELEFASPICNIVGNDFKVWETSYGTPNCVAWPEHAAVWARQDLCQDWVLLTPEVGVCQDFEVDLGFLSYARYIRIEDRTDETFPAFQSSNQDAFDVDGVEGYVSCALPVIDPADLYSPFAYSNLNQGQRANGTDVLASRSFPERMLGTPQMSDATTSPAANNFYSLGFSGSVVLQFPLTMINVLGPDILVYETTFGDNLSRACSVYPERARFEGSVNGSDFFDMEVEVTPNDAAGAILCRDGQLNIPAAYGGINYIRITDMSTAGSFSGSADAYDVDGLIGINQQSLPCVSSAIGGQRLSEDMEIGEGEMGVSVYPNPADKVATITVGATNSQSDYTIRVVDMMGRTVSVQSVNNSGGSFTQDLNISNLPSGVYVVTVENKETREVTRLIKK